MKQPNLILAFFCALLLLLPGCDDSRGGPNGPETSVTIVRFKDPACTKNVIVWDVKGDKRFVLMRGNKCERTYWINFPRREDENSIFLDPADEVNFKERYRDPFWALPDGWYLIDWAWCNLVSDAYPYLGHTLLTDVTFDNLYDYGDCYFDKSLPHKTVEYEKKIIYIGDLMAYMHPDGNYPSFELRYTAPNSGKDIVYTQRNQYFFHSGLGMDYLPVASNVRPCLCDMDEQMDAYWAVLQNQLSTLINNGDLNKIKRFNVNTLDGWVINK